MGSLRAVFGVLGPVLRIDPQMMAQKGGERVLSGLAIVDLETEEAAQAAVAKGIPYRGRVLKVVLLPDFKSALRGDASAERKERGAQKAPRQGRGKK